MASAPFLEAPCAWRDRGQPAPPCGHKINWHEAGHQLKLHYPPTTGQRDQIHIRLDLANPSIRRLVGRIETGTPYQWIWGGIAIQDGFIVRACRWVTDRDTYRHIYIYIHAYIHACILTHPPPDAHIRLRCRCWPMTSTIERCGASARSSSSCGMTPRPRSCRGNGG